ncbi:hypothetical protein JXO59_14835, partial [candidate division KSB1 bacterium]|nr:hypothetical protein [candidate division KSB1 bacterium]
RDKGLEANKIYWYRVSALDWLGNESSGAKIATIPAISTFTYSNDVPKTPVVQDINSVASPECGVLVRWQPAFNANKHQGFLVFRSLSQKGDYRQVSAIVRQNKFLDQTAIKGNTYWYQVQAIDHENKLSQPSAAVQYKY